MYFMGWGCQPHAQPPTWRTRPPSLYPPETGWPSYTPRHWVLILVAFYDTHGLRWSYSLSRSPQGGPTFLIALNLHSEYKAAYNSTAILYCNAFVHIVFTPPDTKNFKPLSLNV